MTTTVDAVTGFWALAEAAPERLALVTPDGRELTGGELLARSRQLAHGLRAAGLQRGDVVAYVLPNGAELLALVLACMETGLYVVPVNTHLAAPEIAYIVDDSEASLVVGHERFGDVCRDAADEVAFPADRRFAVGQVEGFRPFGDLVDGHPDAPPPDRATGMVMNYTSGTTGRPKGVRRPLPDVTPDTGCQWFAGLLRMFGAQPGSDDVHLTGSPLYHTAVLLFAMGSLQLGHTVVLMDKWLPEPMLELIERHRVTTSHMVPTQFQRLLALPDEVKHRYDLSSLRHMVHAAAPCPVATKREMIEWWGPVIDEYYGSTEGGGTMVFAEDWLQHPGTVGRPWPTAEIAIFDDEGIRITEPDATGTVYFKTPGFEYHKDAQKTSASRIGEFATVGDMGYLDADGYLFLRDRKGDMIITGGANVYPAEVEATLLGHPAVRDVAVFGIPDDDWGEQVKAAVELSDGWEPGDGTAEEILDYCEGRLAHYKTPRSVDFVTEMPRDPNGKLYKRKLRDPYWAGRVTSI
jgi:long-chain acyl-CoA synthetase